MTPARLLREAEKIGPATIALFEAIMKAKPHPEQGFRSCLGILVCAPQRRRARHPARLRTQPPGGLTHGGTGTTDVKER
jgi:hypothetical protein